MKAFKVKPKVVRLPDDPRLDASPEAVMGRIKGQKYDRSGWRLRPNAVGMMRARAARKEHPFDVSCQVCGQPEGKLCLDSMGHECRSHTVRRKRSRRMRRSATSG